MRTTLILAVALFMSSCGLYERDRQIKTVVYIQSIAVKIEARRDQMRRPPTAADARRILDSVNYGNDAWTHRLIYASNGHSYVVISSGRDGRFESDDPAYYFSMAPHEVRGDPDRDIVLRDGEFVARAGK